MKSVQTLKSVIQKPAVLADDNRGVIEKLVGDGSMSVLRITSKKGTVRANHYHQHDSHLCYLAKGKIRYVERPALDHAAPLKEYMVVPGQLFYTAPMVAHAMEFLADSEFYCFTPRSGNQAEYENDVIRVELISPDEAAKRAWGENRQA